MATSKLDSTVNRTKNMDKNFEELYKEYIYKETSDERKTEIILQIHEILKTLNGKNDAFIKCRDGEERSLNSDDIEDLYTIYKTLKARSASEIAREKALNKNLYTPDNPYPGK